MRYIIDMPRVLMFERMEFWYCNVELVSAELMTHKAGAQYEECHHCTSWYGHYLQHVSSQGWDKKKPDCAVDGIHTYTYMPP